MENDLVFWIIEIFILTTIIVIVTIDLIDSPLQEENKLLELNNSNLKTELEYHKEINKLITEDNSKRLIKIYNLTNQINNLKSEREKLISELGKEYETQSQLKESIKQAKSKRGLINPTYKELKNFVDRDNIDRKQWSSEFDCTEFSNEFIDNFANEGYFSCTVEIDYKCDKERCGHIIVAINTTDKGLIYFEPQDDKIIKNMRVGENYCNLADWNCNMKMTKISSCFDLQNQ